MGNTGSKVTITHRGSSEKLLYERTRILNCGKWFDSIWYKDVAGLVCRIDVVDCQRELKVWYQTDSTVKIGLQVMHFFPLTKAKFRCY